MKDKKFYFIIVPLIVAVCVLMYVVTGIAANSFETKKCKLSDCEKNNSPIVSELVLTEE